MMAGTGTSTGNGTVTMSFTKVRCGLSHLCGMPSSGCLLAVLLRGEAGLTLSFDDLVFRNLTTMICSQQVVDGATLHDGAVKLPAPVRNQYYSAPSTDITLVNEHGECWPGKVTSAPTSPPAGPHSRATTICSRARR